MPSIASSQGNTHGHLHRIPFVQSKHKIWPTLKGKELGFTSRGEACPRACGCIFKPLQVPELPQSDVSNKGALCSSACSPTAPMTAPRDSFLP